MPGVIDTHVHINEPGRTEWEGFDSATRSAAAGGITTLVDMPLHSIPATTRVDTLLAKMELAQAKAWVDVAFWAGLGRGTLGNMGRMRDAGVVGFSASLIPTGSDELRELGEGELRVALPKLRELGVPLFVHAELPGPIEHAWAALAAEGADARLYANWLRARPRNAEIDAIELLLHVAETTRAHIHVANLSAADTLPALRRARAAGVPITLEAAPPWLHFAAEEIRDGDTLLKCAPPIRDAADREALWEALGDGSIDTIGSAHSPCPPELKQRDTGDFASAWAGVSGLQLTLPLVWTGARVRGFSPHHLAEWLCSAPARLTGIEGRKGSIAPGRDADLVIWDAEAEFEVDPAQLLHRHNTTPYAGARLRGVVRTTILRGHVICEDGHIGGDRIGRIVKR
jgi:allantoinase